MSGSDLERLSRLVLDEFKRVHDCIVVIATQFTDVRDELRAIRKQLASLEEAVGNMSGIAAEIDHLL